MNLPAETARAWVEVDLGALVANAKTIAARASARLLPMVKANGYGLGAIAAARALRAAEPWGFGVATVEEGAELRGAGITEPIVVFTPLAPSWIDACLAHRLRPAIGDLSSLRFWLARGDAPFHVEIDTGMSRAGIRFDDAAALDALAALVRRAPGWEGLFTHFHSADHDADATARQAERFDATIARIGRPALLHAANSAASLAGRHAYDVVRPGIFLYGGEAGGEPPRPVAALRARVVAVRRVGPGDAVSYGATWQAARPTTIATLAIGYADGVHRALSGRGVAEICDTVRPFAGRVTMDMTMLDVGDLSVAPGDVATLFGGRVTLDTQATAARTIGYELLTALGPRIPRIYREAGA
jgi:alanine racemase